MVSVRCMTPFPCSSNILMKEMLALNYFQSWVSNNGDGAGILHLFFVYCLGGRGGDLKFEIFYINC